MHDLIVLGGGPAGYSAAERAAQAGLRTVLIEKSDLGGVCLNEGCIPSKTLLYSSKLFAAAKKSQAFGVSAADVAFDLLKVMARKRKIVETHRRGIASMLKKKSVSVETGCGRVLLSRGDIFNVAVDGREIQGKRLLLCTGSEALRLSIPGATQSFVLTNREILSIDDVPRNIVIIGAGSIGLEFATFFAEVGSSVTVVELLPSIGGDIDGEIGGILKRELEKSGVRFLLQAKVKEIGDHVVCYESADGTGTAAADLVLMSVGRRPCVEGIGLDNIDIAVERGAIVADGTGRTSRSGVWAAGDVNGRSMLAHTAYREARACIDDMCGKVAAVDYDAIAGVTYTHPEVARVGLTGEEARRRGIDVWEAKLPLSYNGRFCAESDDQRGMCKVVVDARSKALLGVHILGGSCSEMIFGAALMVQRRMTVGDIDGMVFPHPTVSEIIQDAVTSAAARQPEAP